MDFLRKQYITMMKKFLMRYIGHANEALLNSLLLGMALSEYLVKNAYKYLIIGHGVEGHGPGSRLIRIKYDIDATPENIVHEIEINDPNENLEKELKSLYQRYGFSLEYPA